MSKPKKPRNKKYHPRDRYVAPCFWNQFPEITRQKVEQIEMSLSLWFSTLESGTATRWEVASIDDCFKVAYVQSAAFENKDYYQGVFYVASASCHLCAQLIEAGKEIPKDCLHPIALGINIFTEMLKTADHTELVKIFTLTAKNQDHLLKMHPNCGFYFSLKDATHNCKTLNRRAMTVLNGKFRTGYIAHNETMERFEWVDPTEETTVPLKENLVLVFAEPLEVKNGQE